MDFINAQNKWLLSMNEVDSLGITYNSIKSQYTKSLQACAENFYRLRINERIKYVQRIESWLEVHDIQIDDKLNVLSQNLFYF